MDRSPHFRIPKSPKQNKLMNVWMEKISVAFLPFSFLCGKSLLFFVVVAEEMFHFERSCENASAKAKVASKLSTPETILFIHHSLSSWVVRIAKIVRQEHSSVKNKKEARRKFSCGGTR